MNSIIIGYGNVGKHLALELKNSGDHVILGRHMVARTAGTTHDFETVDIDLLDLSSVEKALDDQDIVYVTTGLPYKLSVWRAEWPTIIENIIAACVKHGAKLVFIDNIYLYGPSPLQIPIIETHPRQPASQKGAVRLELVNKLESAMKDGLDVLIIRCADFYGPAVASGIPTMAVDAALKDKKAYLFGDQATHHAFSYVPDIAKAVVLLAHTDDCFNQTWHAPTAAAITGTEMQNLIETEVGQKAKWAVLRPKSMRLLALFVPILRELREMMYQYENDYVFDSSKFQTRFPDFVVTPYTEGIKATVTAARSK